MERLPTEIKHKIFTYFQTEVLTEIIAKVSQEWDDLADDIIRSRIDKIDSTIQHETSEDIKCKLTPTEMNKAAEVLKLYEKTYLFRKFKVRSSRVCEEMKDVRSFILKIEQDRGCDCTGIAQCICRALRIMSCHKLIIVQIPDKIEFYHIEDPWKGIQQGESLKDAWKAYVCLPHNIRVDNNTHTALSVYQDRIVAQETSRVLILFQVIEVDHNKRTVTVEKLRRLFLPSWSCAIMLFKTKVFAVYTTGNLGVWDQTTDDLDMSRDKCGDEESLKTMRLTMMYRCNNLIFVTLSRSASRMGTSWTIIDANDNAILPKTVSLSKLINETFPVENDECKFVIQINLLNNAFFVHCKVGEPGQQGDSKIFIARIKRDPCLQDFLSAENFAELLCTPKSDSMIKCINFEGGLVIPMLPPFLTPELLQPPPGGQVPVLSLFGVQKYRNIKHKENELRLLCISVLNF